MTRDSYVDSVKPRLVQHLVDLAPCEASVASGGATVTVASLRQEASRLADDLAAEGIGFGDALLVQAEAGIPAWTLALACLKLGAPFIPLSPSLPDARLHAIQQTVDARALVRPDTERGAPVIDELVPRTPSSGRRLLESDTAFFIFTSGSTGAPKGIRISHRAAVAFTAGYVASIPIPEGQRILSTSPFQFVGAFCDFVFAALTGSTLVLPTATELAQPRRLIACGASSGITAVHAVPTLWSILLGDVTRPMLSTWDLEHALFTGEPLTTGLVSRVRTLWPSLTIWNDYGQTETIGCSIHRVTDDDLQEGRIPIGRPLPGVEMLVLDREGGGIVDGSATGELGVRADSLFDGYVGVENGSNDGNALFHTGDIVHRDNRGTFHYLGRTDSQVKVRGNRLELAEVEAAISVANWVRDVVVVHVNDALHAFVVAAEGPKDERSATTAVRRLCAERLPSFAVPRHVRFLTALPQNANGKVDRQELSELAGPGDQSRRQ